MENRLGSSSSPSAVLGDMKVPQADAASLSWICSVVEATNILVIGCGNGAVPILLAREGGEVVGIDPDKESIAHTQRLLDKESPEVRSRLKLHSGDILSCSFQKAEFGSIVLPDVFGQLGSPERFVHAASDLLDAHGSLIASISFRGVDSGKRNRKRFIIGFLRLLDRWFLIDEYRVSDAWFGVKLHLRSDSVGQVSNLNWDLALASERALLAIERDLFHRLNEAEATIAKLSAVGAPPSVLGDAGDESIYLARKTVSGPLSPVGANVIGTFEEGSDFAFDERADSSVHLVPHLERKIAVLEREAESFRAIRSILEKHFRLRLESPAAARGLVSDALSLRQKLVSAYDELGALKETLKGKSRDMDLAMVRATHGLDDVLEGSRSFVREQSHIIASQLAMIGEIRANLSHLSVECDSLTTVLSSQEDEMERLRQQIAFIENSVRFKLGAEMLAAFRSPARWLQLPRRIYQIYRGWKESGRALPDTIGVRGGANQSLTRISSGLAKLYSQIDVAAHAGAGNRAGAADNLVAWWVNEATVLPLRELIKPGDAPDVRFGNGVPLLFRLKTHGASSLLVRLQFKAVRGAVHICCKGVVDSGFSRSDSPIDIELKTIIPCRQEAKGDALLLRIAVPKGCDSFDLSLNGGEALVLHNHVDVQVLLPGISVVIPSYMGEHKVPGALMSLARQTLGHELIEVIVVANGPRDATLEKVQEFAFNHPDVAVKTAYLDEPSAGGARNLGLEIAGREYVVFLDDDDSLSENYLQGLFESAAQDVLVFAQIMDSIDGELYTSSINDALLAAETSGKVDAQSLAGVATMSACKLIPSAYAKQVRFNHELRSGEDVHYFVVLFSMFNPGFRIVPARKNSFYIRTLTARSVSRQEQSREFSIDQRLAVISAVQRDAAGEPRSDIFRMYLNSMRAQIQFCMRYLEKMPEDRAYFNQRLLDFGIAGTDCVRWANERMAEELVFSYCFPPFIDTAGIVMAKRINNAGRPVNVISNDMSAVRTEDSRLLEIVSTNIGRLDIVKCKPSFSSWPLITEYIDAAYSIAEKQIESRGRGYERIYSRVMWPGSHFAAAKYKAAHPEVRWIAEFSDPVLIDIHGKTRTAEMSFDWIEDLGISNLGQHLKSDGSINSNMYYWCEMLAYLMADELIFTNENQMNYMLSFVDIPSVKNRVRSIAVISPHPTLPPSYYDLSAASVETEGDKLSFAYFGSFYESRGVHDVLAALKGLDENQRARVVFHIYTAQGEALTSDPHYSDLIECVKLHPLVGYLDFLKLTSSYDYLVVCDAQTVGKKSCNPYLPSKISDYIGSPTAKVWAVVEHGSPLHMLSLQMPEKVGVTLLGDVKGSMDFVGAALSDRFG